MERVFERVVLIIMGAFVAFITMTMTDITAREKGFERGVKYANESCYALIDFSQGHSPTLATN